jgi:hypothetical protein
MGVMRRRGNGYRALLRGDRRGGISLAAPEPKERSFIAIA